MLWPPIGFSFWASAEMEIAKCCGVELRQGTVVLRRSALESQARILNTLELERRGLDKQRKDAPGIRRGGRGREGEGVRARRWRTEVSGMRQETGMEAQKVTITFFLLPFGGAACFGRKGERRAGSLQQQAARQEGPGRTGIQARDGKCEPSKKAV
jgi:hypothetical protein